MRPADVDLAATASGPGPVGWLQLRRRRARPVRPHRPPRTRRRPRRRRQTLGQHTRPSPCSARPSGRPSTRRTSRSGSPCTAYAGSGRHGTRLERHRAERARRRTRRTRGGRSAASPPRADRSTLVDAPEGQVYRPLISRRRQQNCLCVPVSARRGRTSPSTMPRLLQVAYPPLPESTRVDRRVHRHGADLLPRPGHPGRSDRRADRRDRPGPAGRGARAGGAYRGLHRAQWTAVRHRGDTVLASGSSLRSSGSLEAAVPGPRSGRPACCPS